MGINTQQQVPASWILDEGFSRLVAVAFVLLGAIFGLLQPAGSAGLGRLGAVAFWVLHGLAAVPCILVGTGLLARLGLARRLSPMAFVVGSGLVAAFLFSFLALGIEFAFGVGDAEEAGEAGPVGWWFDELGGVAPPFLLAWILVNLPRLMRLGGPERSAGESGESGPAPEPEPPSSEPVPEGVLARLPSALGNDVVLLSSDLHYLHVYTPRGRTMLLYNLADAERELGEAGLRIHRSHWVADRHVLGVRRTANGLVCRLAGGHEVPVSRRRQKEVIARYGLDTEYRRGAAVGDGG